MIIQTPGEIQHQETLAHDREIAPPSRTFVAAAGSAAGRGMAARITSSLLCSRPRTVSTPAVLPVMPPLLRHLPEHDACG
jgi:hypothetical protein